MSSINCQVELAPRDECQTSKVDQDMVDYLIRKVSKNPDITLNTLKEQIYMDLSEKQMYGHCGLKIKLYKVPE